MWNLQSRRRGGDGVKDTGVIVFYILGFIVGVGIALIRRKYGL